MSQAIVLRLFKNDELIDVKQFSDEQIVIGRSPEAKLLIEDDSVSPLHAVIELRESKYFISDLGSESGVFIKGSKVLEAVLNSGDKITIGGFKVHFFIGVPMGAAISGENGDVPEGDDVTSEEVLAEEDHPVEGEVPVEEDPPVENKVVPRGQQFSENQMPQESVIKAKEVIRVSEGTYAPESAFSSIKDIIKPGKGTVIEVVVSWQERVISTSHFSKSCIVNIGTDPSCDIILPLLGTELRKHKLLRIDSQAHVIITKEMDGEYITGGNKVKSFRDLARNNQLEAKGAKFILDIAQGDMAIIKFGGGRLLVTVRYVPETPKAALAPFLDLTASEVAGVVLALVVASIFSLYMMIYAPEKLDDLETKVEEPFRKAVISFKPPKPKPVVVAAAETRKNKPKEVVVVKNIKKKAPTAAKKKGKTGKSGSVRKTPKKIKKVKNKRISQKRKGGAVRTGSKGASAKSKKPDPKNMGILSVFGNRGTQEKLNKVYSGSGELTGMAGAATGTTGFKDDRAGNSLGAKTKRTSGSGKGKKSIGVSGPITGGRGAGNFGFGSGSVGKKSSVLINVGGQEEAFVGSIDREAIRRVILDNISQIRNCYERILNQKPDLFGKLVIEWDIENKGKVKKAKAIKNTTGSRKLASCVVKRLRSWRFPEPPDDQIARVTYPFVFAAK